MSESDEPEPRRAVPIQNVTMNIVMMVTVVIGVAGGGIWLNDKLVRIDVRLEQIETKVANPWSVDRMRDWCNLFQLMNQDKGLKVPEVR